MANNDQTSSRPITIPHPDHLIIIERNTRRVVVNVAGHVVADTHHALTLKEVSYPMVQYIPRHDAWT
ncbi:DUF427 domain-containing protein [Dyella monticola]|uniref:DUF427 domain-containing protein n=1 Tax=Dyella monticola TaxID=1927958 RepID=UPI0022A836E3|nr:DUF427 domain-containing protein [Dyella monticola]